MGEEKGVFHEADLWYNNAKATSKEELVTELFFPELSKEELLRLSSLALAHVGDGVYELLARTYVVGQKGGLARQMHQRTVELVRAPTQARAIRGLLREEVLTEEEKQVFLRGRNCHSHAAPKSASPEDYAHATGLEALFGWLYLTGQKERGCLLFEQILAMNPWKKEE